MVTLTIYNIKHLSMYAGEVRAPISAIAPLPMNERKVIAHRAMLMIERPHAIVNLGIGMPEVHCQTVSHTHALCVSPVPGLTKLTVSQSDFPLKFVLGC